MCVGVEREERPYWRETLLMRALPTEILTEASEQRVARFVTGRRVTKGVPE